MDRGRTPRVQADAEGREPSLMDRAGWRGGRRRGGGRVVGELHRVRRESCRASRTACRPCASRTARRCPTPPWAGRHHHGLHPGRCRCGATARWMAMPSRAPAGVHGRWAAADLAAEVEVGGGMARGWPWPRRLHRSPWREGGPRSRNQMGEGRWRWGGEGGGAGGGTGRRETGAVEGGDGRDGVRPEWRKAGPGGARPREGRIHRRPGHGSEIRREEGGGGGRRGDEEGG